MFFHCFSQYLQMKWPILDVPGTAALKDSRSPTPGHLVSISQVHKPHKHTQTHVRTYTATTENIHTVSLYQIENLKLTFIVQTDDTNALFKHFTKIRLVLNNSTMDILSEIKTLKSNN